MVAHITQDELIKRLSGTECHNGFANRFLWAISERKQLIPFPEEPSKQEVDLIVNDLKDAVAFGKTAGRVELAPCAKQLYVAIYPELSKDREDRVGPIIARAETQVLRISLIYALLDQKRTIGEEHLRAALAVWKYCEESCEYIFGNSTGDSTADRILTGLRDRPDGMTKTGIHRLFSNQKSGNELDQALRHLEKLGLARPITKTTGGRNSETWVAVDNERSEESEQAA